MGSMGNVRFHSGFVWNPHDEVGWEERNDLSNYLSAVSELSLRVLDLTLLKQCKLAIKLSASGLWHHLWPDALLEATKEVGRYWP